MPEDLVEVNAEDYIEAWTAPESGTGKGPKIAGLLADDIATTGVSRVFTLRVHYGERDGWTYDGGALGNPGLDWSYLLPIPGDIQNTDGQTADFKLENNVKVTKAVLHRVECKVYMKKMVDGKEKKGVLTITHKGNFAAIGGALKLGVSASRYYAKPTWTNLLGDPSQAFYLQYFAGGSQDPQSGRIEIPLQPDNTILTPHYPENLREDPARSLEPATLRTVVADDAFPASPVTFTFKLTYIDDDGTSLTKEVNDITTAVKDVSQSGGPRLVNTFTARMPKPLDGLILESFADFDPNPQFTPYNDRCGRKDQFRLVDTYDTNMPGVYVQERFTPQNPNIQVNGHNRAWHTLTNPAGRFHSVDWLLYWAPNPWGVREYTHTFYAGTESTYPGTAGLNVGTYKIKFMSNNGQKGTAEQNKQ